MQVQLPQLLLLMANLLIGLLYILHRWPMTIFKIYTHFTLFLFQIYSTTNFMLLEKRFSPATMFSRLPSRRLRQAGRPVVVLAYVTLANCSFTSSVAWYLFAKATATAIVIANSLLIRRVYGSSLVSTLWALCNLWHKFFGAVGGGGFVILVIYPASTRKAGRLYWITEQTDVHTLVIIKCSFNHFRTDQNSNSKPPNETETISKSRGKQK